MDLNDRYLDGGFLTASLDLDLRSGGVLWRRFLAGTSSSRFADIDRLRGSGRRFSTSPPRLSATRGWCARTMSAGGTSRRFPSRSLTESLGFGGGGGDGGGGEIDFRLRFVTTGSSDNSSSSSPPSSLSDRSSESEFSEPEFSDSVLPELSVSSSAESSSIPDKLGVPSDSFRMVTRKFSNEDFLASSSSSENEMLSFSEIEMTNSQFTRKLLTSFHQTTTDKFFFAGPGCSGV